MTEATAAAELDRMLTLRARYYAVPVPPERRWGLSDADLLASAFVLSEMGVAVLWCDSGELVQLLRSAGLSEYFLRRTGRDLELRQAPGGASAPEEQAGDSAALLLDARRPIPEGVQGFMDRLSITILYGVRGPTPLTHSPVARLNGNGAALVSLAGIGVAFWNCTAMAVVREALAPRVEEIRARLAGLTHDRSMDPLLLAESCLHLKESLQARGGDELAELRNRVSRQEDEIHALKTRLAKQQKALALYSANPPTRGAGTVTGRR
jgi:hypothetical protein